MNYAVDTNILLRFFRKDDKNFELVASSIKKLIKKNINLCFASQSIREFWNVSTRPLKYNGLGLSIKEVSAYVRDIESTLNFLPELSEIYSLWRHLVIAHEVRGVQVHDAYLAATLEAHGVQHLLTFNGADFKRFPAITPVHPAEVQA